MRDTPSDGRIALAAAVMLLAVLGPAALAVDSSPGGESADTRPAAGKSQEPAGEASNEAAGEGSAEEPVEPFVPSESISADSAVAFPVDI